MPARMDVTGQRYGRLIAIQYVGWNGAYKTLWQFRCDCGSIIVRRLAQVRRGDVRSCGCLRHEGGYKAPNRLAPGESSFNQLYARYRKGARVRQLNWALDKQTFRRIVDGDCYYCGQGPAQRHLTTPQTNGAYVYNGIDRADNNRGYELDNVVSCCGECNHAKGVRGSIAFLAWVERVYRHRVETRA